MQVFEYENKETKEKAVATDVLSVLAEMGELEDYNGVTQEKILDNWYEMKKRLTQAIMDYKKDEVKK